MDTKLVEDVSTSIVASTDRGVWRKTVFFKFLEWMRDFWTPNTTKRLLRKKTIDILKAIVSNVRNTRKYGRAESLHLARELKVVWFKVLSQVKDENGDHNMTDNAREDNLRRENEGISD